LDYNLLKALHVGAVLIWFGGVMLNGIVLALVARSPGTMPDTAFRHFRRWDLWVSNPAQGFAWIFGIWLIIAGGWTSNGWLPDGWLLAKLVFVFVLAGIHGSQSAALRKLAGGKAAERRIGMMRYSAMIALVSAVAISVLVVMKPF